MNIKRLATIAAMSFEEFVTEQERNNLADVPARTKMLIMGGMVGWKEALLSWWERYKKEHAGENQ